MVAEETMEEGMTIATVADVQNRADEDIMAAEVMIMMVAVSKVAEEAITVEEMIAMKAVSNKAVEEMITMAAGTTMANNKAAMGAATATNPTTTTQEADPRTPATAEAEAMEMMMI